MPRAAVIKEYGTPDESVEVVDIKKLTLSDDDDIIVKIHATGVSFPDVLMHANKYQVSLLWQKTSHQKKH